RPASPGSKRTRRRRRRSASAPPGTNGVSGTRTSSSAGLAPAAPVRRGRSGPLFAEPDGRQVLPEVVARGPVPTLKLLVVDDDALPLQQRHIVGLHQAVALHLADDLGAFGDIDRAALLLVELVDLGVVVAGVAARRQLLAQEFRELGGRVVHVVRLELDG